MSWQSDEKLFTFVKTETFEKQINTKKEWCLVSEFRSDTLCFQLQTMTTPLFFGLLSARKRHPAVVQQAATVLEPIEYGFFLLSLMGNPDSQKLAPP